MPSWKMSKVTENAKITENDKNHWIMLEICKKAKKTEKCEMSAKKRKMQQKYMLKITENGQISTKG